MPLPKEDHGNNNKSKIIYKVLHKFLSLLAHLGKYSTNLI